MLFYRVIASGKVYYIFRSSTKKAEVATSNNRTICEQKHSNPLLKLLVEPTNSTCNNFCSAAVANSN